MISVIIATKNRAEGLKNLTLKTLCTQNDKNFAVYVCDASDNEATKTVCGSFQECLDIHYMKAPRSGLAKQRNDAIDTVLAEKPETDIIVFLDDDVELSEDAVRGIRNTFQDQHVFGVGIPIRDNNVEDNLLARLLKMIFLNFKFSSRYITKYAYQYQVNNEENGTEVNWLSGCGMAYRKECFAQHPFDERLCRFGGYSLCEDAVFSVEVYVSGKKLKLSDAGYLKHIRNIGARMNYRSMVASMIYNRQILFRALNKHEGPGSKTLHGIAYKWNQLYVLLMMLIRACFAHEVQAFWEGFHAGRKAVIDEFHQ